MSVQTRKRKHHADGHIERLVACSESYKSKLCQATLDGTVTKRQMKVLAQQVYLQEKWPSHIAHVYLGLDEEALSDREVVKYMLSIIEAENLGVGSGGVSHTELARRFAFSIGLSERSLSAARPIPSNRMLMDWCDMSALDRPWLEALAVHVACESQASSMRAIEKGLRTSYGKSTDDVMFWSIHGGSVEIRHMKNGLAILGRYVNAENRDSVEYAYEMSCRLVRDFYDSILEV